MVAREVGDKFIRRAARRLLLLKMVFSDDCVLGATDRENSLFKCGTLGIILRGAAVAGCDVTSPLRLLHLCLLLDPK